MTQIPALPPLVLASTSRYRRDLLARLRLPFDTLSPGVDESPRTDELPADRALRLARAKAAAVAASRPEAVVIGSDQVAVCAGRILDKPGNAERSRQQLRQLSGSSAVFHTAVAVICRERQFVDEFIDATTVTFRDLSDMEIDRYVAAEQPFDCAGGFRAESLGSALFAGVGSIDPTGLIGLPLIRVAQSLRVLGFSLP